MMPLLEPPPHYDHPYRGQVIEQRLSALQIIKLCHGPAMSCAWVSKGVCHIALSQDETDPRLIALIRRHEIGHCNGWPAWHPGARRIDHDPDSRGKAHKIGHVNVTF